MAFIRRILGAITARILIAIGIVIVVVAAIDLVRHAKRLVFQLAEVLVTRAMLTRILERISWLRLAPG